MQPLAPGKPSTADSLIADAATGLLDNGRLRVHVDTRTGGTDELHARGIEANLVDTANNPG